MIGEIIFEIVVRVFLEEILCGLAYYTGRPVARLLTLGRLDIAPYRLMWERNQGKEKPLGLHWSPLLHQLKRKPMLRAEIVSLIGLLAWIGGGVAIYQLTR